MGSTVIFLLLSLCVAIHAKQIPTITRPSSTLWGVVLNGNEEGVEVDTATVDPTSGEIKNQMEVFRYLGGAAMYDGCSVLDTKNQVLYFAVDFQSSFIFAVDIKNNQILPPISIPGDTYVSHLAWDEKEGRLFALAGFGPVNAYVIMFAADGSLPTTAIANLSSPGYRYFEFAAYDWSNQNYYFSYYSNYTQYVGYFPVDGSFDDRKSFQISCPFSNTTLHHLYYDNTHSNLIAIVDIGNNEFFFLTMDPTGGSCVSAPLNMGTSPIIMAATYDTSKLILYISVAYNGGNSMVYTYDVQSKQLSSVVVNNALSDIQIDVTGI
eukprot:Phypoly_transcript_11996.p1 GENE.Phypoly_transcript_11996~~Phypoly_transcript_11996.p1  ORF type:complete len:344 (+),score=68.02 Phypoly_transcript_11996:68-1033(+)